MPRVGLSDSSEIQADVVEEGRRLMGVAEAASVPVRLLGGVAVRIRASSGLPSSLEREYKDIDLATSRKGSGAVAKLLKEQGYEPHVGFNAMNARERLLFYDEPNRRQLDVFVSSFRMCHEIPLEQRLTVDAGTVPLAELLLTKLQIIELNEKDVRDTVALFHEHEVTGDDSGVNAARVAELCGADWGLWRTITANLENVRTHFDRYALTPAENELVTSRVEAVEEWIEAAPKSRAWRLRAKVGERKKWYETPEEV
jgi:Uncharacterised nucleotidyltransferase